MGDAVYCRHGRDVGCYGCWQCDSASCPQCVSGMDRHAWKSGGFIHVLKRDKHGKILDFVPCTR